MKYLKQLQIIDNQLTNKEYDSNIVMLYFLKVIPFGFFVSFLFFSLYLMLPKDYAFDILGFLFLANIGFSLFFAYLINLMCLFEYKNYKIGRKETDLFTKNMFLYPLKMVFGFQLFNLFKALKIHFIENKKNDLDSNEKKDAIIEKIITNKDLLKEIILMKKNKQENEIYKKYIYPLLNNEHNTDLDSQEILALQSLSKNKNINIY